MNYAFLTAINILRRKNEPRTGLRTLQISQLLTSSQSEHRPTARIFGREDRGATLVLAVVSLSLSTVEEDQGHTLTGRRRGRRFLLI